MSATPTIQTTYTGASGTTSASLNMTVGAGSNQCLIILATSSTSLGTPTWAGSGTGITLIQSLTSGGNQHTTIWYLKAPTQTTDNLTVSGTGHTVINAYLFSGVDQTTPIGANTGTETSSGTSHSCTFTTDRDKSIIISALSNQAGQSGSSATGTNQTYDYAKTTSDFSLEDSHQTTTTAGSYTQSFTTANTTYALVSVEVHGMPAVTYTLTASPASFSYTTLGDTFQRTINLIAAPVSYTYSALTAIFTTPLSHTLIIAPASYIYTTGSALFQKTLTMIVAPANYIYTALSATLNRLLKFTDWTVTPNPTPSAYTVIKNVSDTVWTGVTTTIKTAYTEIKNNITKWS